jgi:hypothetical protein
MNEAQYSNWDQNELSSMNRPGGFGLKNAFPASFRTWRGFALILSAACLLAAAPTRGLAYVLPAEQLVGFMLENFSKFRVLAVTRSVRVLPLNEGDAAEPAFEEEVRTQAPNSVSVRILPATRAAGAGGGDGTDPAQGPAASAWARSDRSFLRLLMPGRASRILDLLREWGISEASVSYTRLDGAIAFHIGEKGPGRPALLLEKERFLPMLLRYRPVPGEESATATVRFLDYRPVPDGWYPFEIRVTTVEGRTFRCSLDRLVVNDAVAVPGVPGRRPGPSPAAEDPE